ncbi:MAG: Gx transporter family protein [Lachnospiraceae bacterium]|nr:Gx transporter family protein [Lachnospiraceae bacterium]
MAKNVAHYSVLIALAMVMSYIEANIPISGAVYGVKLGLANVVVLLALYVYGFKAATFISIIRIFLVGILFGTSYSLLFSLAGGTLSLLVMGLLKRFKIGSIIGVSVFGAVFHNFGQIIVAILLLNISVMYYLPILIVSGIVSGVLIGIVSGIVIKRVRRYILCYRS